MSACRTLATRGVPGLTRSSRREPSYLQSHHGRHSCQQGRLGQGHQERQEHPGVQQGRSHHGHPGRGGEQRPVSPRGRGPVGPGEQQTQLWPGGRGSSRRSRLTLGPGDPSRPGEPSAPGEPCREREGGRHQPGGGRQAQAKAPGALRRALASHRAGDCLPHVQTRQGVQPIQGGPWDQGGHVRHWSQKDLVCQVRP